MNDNVNESTEQFSQPEESFAGEVIPPEQDGTAQTKAHEMRNAVEKKLADLHLTKKKIAIIGGVLLVAIIVLVIALIPSKFEKVKNECVKIAGQAGTGKDYFSLDTLPDSYENMDETLRALLLPDVQERTLKAIKYANEELGFPGVYSLMLKTNALMGRQTEENDKYKVTWSYHPDDGLEVTYRKK